MRRLPLSRNMIAPESARGKSLLAMPNLFENARKQRIDDHEVVNPPTITPNFGQSPVTLDWDKTSVASRPGPVRAPDSSAPQPPGARSAGPVEFRVRFNPLMPSGRRSEEHTSELQSLRHLVCRLL